MKKKIAIPRIFKPKGTLLAPALLSLILPLLNNAQTLEDLYDFGRPPANPHGALVEVSPGEFYGTTEKGGVGDLGTVFKVSSSGKLITLASFNGGTGSNPIGGLARGSDGNFYGTTSHGGTKNLGTVFQMSPSW